MKKILGRKNNIWVIPSWIENVRQFKKRIIVPNLVLCHLCLKRRKLQSSKMFVGLFIHPNISIAFEHESVERRVIDYSCTAWLKFFLSSTLKSISGWCELLLTHINTCRVLTASLIPHEKKCSTQVIEQLWNNTGIIWKDSAKSFCRSGRNLSLSWKRMFYAFIWK